MIHSFRFRLLITFIAVIAITIGTTFFFIGQRVAGEIQRFQEAADQIRIARMEGALLVYYYRQRGWEGIQPFVEQMGDVYNRHIILTDAAGIVVADSQGDLLGDLYQPDSPGKTISPPRGGTTWGELYVSPQSSTDPISLWHLQKPISRYILWGCFIGGGVALAFTFFLSRRISTPVRALTSAAKRLGGGDLSQRVCSNDKLGLEF